MNAPKIWRAMTTLTLLCVLASGCSTGDQPVPQSDRSADTTTSASGTAVAGQSDITGAAWRPLPRYLPDNSFASVPAKGSVEFLPDGRWMGFDGCNRARGTYRLSAAGLVMTGGPITDVWCANMSPHEQLNGTLVTVNASGTRLTASDATGHVLIEYSR
jgi:heat shock protein HslJ